MQINKDKLRYVPTIHLQRILATNPTAKTFPLGGYGMGPDVPRAVLQAELDSRPHIENKIVGLHAVK